jgi:hypothetical protein
MGERSATDKYQIHVKNTVETKLQDWSDDSSLKDIESAFDYEVDDNHVEFSFATDSGGGGSSSDTGKKASIDRVATIFLNKSFIPHRKVYGDLPMKMKHQANTYYDYQERAKAFSIGQGVSPYHGDSDMGGIVSAVFPAIGMVDVEFPNGIRRYPVEDLKITDTNPLDLGQAVEVAGGMGQVPVSAGRVASMHMNKTAIYWAGVDRKYRMKRTEGKPHCPKCPETALKPTSYKRRNGVSERLLGCPSCLFLIKRDDLI